MKEGDIYSWSYKAEVCTDPYRYHCKSQIAVFEDGLLIDTFWGTSPTDNSFLDPEKVDLVLLGNRHEFEELNDREDFYDPSDLVVMRHSNNSRAKSLKKPGATRSIDAMRKTLHEKQDAERRQIENSIRELERLAVAEVKIEAGDIERLYF